MPEASRHPAATSAPVRDDRTLSPPEAALTLRRDLWGRTTMKRCREELRASVRRGDAAAFWRQALAIERQVSGVFSAAELEAEARRDEGRGQRPRGFDNLVPGGRFTGLPAQPRIAAATVALAAATLEGRLLALFPNCAGVPDQMLAQATHYSREYVRQALHRTLTTIGIDPKAHGTAIYPRRSSQSTGTTRIERATQERARQLRSRRSAQARARRSRAAEFGASAEARRRLDADVSAGRLYRWTHKDFEVAAAYLGMSSEEWESRFGNSEPDVYGEQPPDWRAS